MNKTYLKNRREILREIGVKVGFKGIKFNPALIGMPISDIQFDNIYEAQLRCYLWETIDRNRKNWAWPKEELFEKTLLGLNFMVTTGELIEILK